MDTKALGPVSKIVSSVRSRDLGVLSAHEAFEGAQLVRDPFRCFHRGDGVLLSMSASKGINYLDANLKAHLSAAESSTLLTDPKVSGIAHVMAQFRHHGLRTEGQFHMDTVEWFLVHLVTELGVSPHNYRQGHNMLGVMDAYQQVDRNLKHQIYDPWRIGETVTLTRKSLQCSEEISMIHDVLAKNLGVFTRLAENCRVFIDEDRENKVRPWNPNGVTSLSRARWAVNMITEQKKHAGYLMGYLRGSMNTLHQIRNTEQNELAVVRDGQEKPIRLLAGVTVIFLPLSFCTSYFGMNLQGVVNTSKTEYYFWAVCGSVALGVVAVILAYVFQLWLLLSGFFLRDGETDAEEGGDILIMDTGLG